MQTRLCKLLYQNENKILELQIASNPKNTFTRELLEEILHVCKSLTQSIENASEEEPLRIVLLTSLEGKYFSNGLDPSLFLDQSEKEIRKSVELLMEASNAYFYLPLPTLAVIKGHCIAAGAVFAIFSDFRFMVEGSGRIGFPEVAIDLNFPSFPARVLSDLVGRRNARDLLYTGKLLKPKEALEIGLLDGIISSENRKPLEDCVQKLTGLSLASAKGIKAALCDSYRFFGDPLVREDVENLTKTIVKPRAQSHFRRLAL